METERQRKKDGVRKTETERQRQKDRDRKTETFLISLFN